MHAYRYKAIDDGLQALLPDAAHASHAASNSRKNQTSNRKGTGLTASGFDALMLSFRDVLGEEYQKVLPFILLHTHEHHARACASQWREAQWEPAALQSMLRIPTGSA